MEKLSPSLTVKRLLPEYISNNFPQFVLFLEKYYEWLESEDQAYGTTRKLETLFDVDSPKPDELFDIMVQPVLKDFPTSAAVDRKFLFKHVSEFFRSKGSLESVETLFRILYNEEIRIYLPKEDIMKVSSGNWVKRIAIEIGNIRYSNGDTADSLNMIGKEIVQYDPSNGAIVSRGVVEDVDFRGQRVTLYLASDKQLREFVADIPLVAIDSQDPELEATIECLIEKGKVTQLIVRNRGRDYTRKPDVVFYGGRYNNGKNARAEAIITNGVVTGFTILNPGEGYLRAPQVRVVNQIFADVLENLGEVTVTAGGEYYKEGTEVNIDPGSDNGSGQRFRISAVNAGSIERIDVLEEGGGYSPNDQIVFDNVTADNYNLFIAPENYQFSIWDKINMAVQETQQRFTYTTAADSGIPQTIVSPRPARRLVPTGFGVHELYQVMPVRADEIYTASFYVKSEYSLASIVITAGGTGYTTTPQVVIEGGNPEIPATATAVVTSGVVTGITIVNPGRGYLSAPIIRISGDTGSGALATSTIDTEIDSLELQIGVEKPAKALPVISGGKVFSINLIEGGANYSAAPVVDFLGGDGEGAQATAIITDGIVSSFDFDSETDGGSGYFSQIPSLYFNKINYGRALLNLKTTSVISVDTYGAAADFSANITPERDGVFRVSITGKIPGLSLNQNAHAALIARSLGEDRAWEMTDTSKGLLVFGALFDQSSIVRPYINIPSVETAVANIGEMSIDDILYEDEDTIAIGDDAFVMEGNDGIILGARVINSGSGYQYKPNITITSTTTSGVGAVAEVLMGRGGSVNDVIVTSIGTGYIGTGVPSDTYRRWQAGMVVFRNQILRHQNNLYIIGGKDTATTTIAPPTHTTSAPVLFDTSATYTFFGKAATITISPPDQNGSLYVGSLTLSSGGTGYTRPPKVTFSSPTGSGTRPDAYAIIAGGSVTSIVLKDGGSGYTEQAIVTIAPPDGPGRTAQVVANMTPTTLAAAQALAEPIIDDGGFITGATVTQAGSGYTTLPTVSITAPQDTSGSRPGLVADIQGSSVTGVRILNGGAGYKAPPVVTIDPPASPLLWLELVSGGSGYTTTPTITISNGGVGQGAVAVASIAAGQINSVAIVARGSGYTTAPTVTITGGGGTGAVIVAHINSEIENDNGIQAVASVGAAFPIASVNTTTNRFIVDPQFASLLRNNDHLTFTSTGTLPAPLTSATYYHIGFLNANSFAILDQEDGFPIDLTSAGSGTITVTGNLIADEILEEPTDTKNLMFESTDYILSEETLDRYHLTIPEQNYIYVDDATTFSAESVTFGERIAITPPEATVENPSSFGFSTNPETVVLGNPFERILRIYADSDFIAELEPNNILVYNDDSELPIPGLTAGRRYYIQAVDSATDSFTLSDEFNGQPLTLPLSRSINVVNFNAITDAVNMSNADIRTLSVGDFVFLYSEPGATVPGGLTDRTLYVVQAVAATNIKLAEVDTPTTAINLTSVGGGSWRLIKTSPMSDHTFTLTADAWEMDTDEITNFVENDVVVYETTGVAAGNLISGVKYFIRDIDETTGTFSLAASFTGGIINILDQGTGNHTLVKIEEGKDRLVFSEEDFNRLSDNVEIEYTATGGVQAEAESDIDAISGAVTDITVTEEGLNYTSVPNVRIVDSDTARPVGGLVLQTGGFGYTSAPNVVIDGGGGAGATATATVTDGVVTAVTLVTPGDGFTSRPNIQFFGGGGSTQATAVTFLKPAGLGATATAVLGTGADAGKVVDVNVVAGGAGYHSAEVIIDPPDTRILPLLERKPYFLTNPDAATNSYQVAEQVGGIPIRFTSGGSGTHTFRTTPRYLQYDPSLLGEYIDETNNILYTSITKTGNFSPLYDDTVLLESLDRVLLETSNLNRNIRDKVSLEEANSVTIVADGNFIDTGDGVWFYTSSTADFGLDTETYYYVRRVANSFGNGFTFHTTQADALAGTNEVELTKTGVDFLRTDDYIRIVKFDRVNQETGGILSINLSNRGKFYKTLPRVHVNVPEGRFGTGALLNPIGDRVGTIKRIEVIDPGYNYPSQLPLVFPLNIHVERPTKNYIVGENVSVGGTTKGTVASWDSHTFLMSINMAAGQTIAVGNTLVGATSAASSVVVERTVGAANAIPKALTTFDGYYNGRKNLIDELNIRVQDNRVYQDFSYVIRSSKPFSEYSNMLKKLAHPSGMFVSGNVNYSVIPVNPELNTVSSAETITTSEEYTP